MTQRVTGQDCCLKVKHRHGCFSLPPLLDRQSESQRRHPISHSVPLADSLNIVMQGEIIFEVDRLYCIGTYSLKVPCFGCVNTPKMKTKVLYLDIL